MKEEDRYLGDDAVEMNKEREWRNSANKNEF